MEAPKLALLVQEHALPALRVVGSAVNVVGPFYLKAFDVAYTAYQTAPVDLIQAAMGLGLCFFGGAFCASIAAMEAFNLATWSTTRAALEDIWEDVQLIREANAADDKAKRLKPDATPSEMAQHKMRVALLAVRDPQKLSIAVGGLYAGWLAVLSTLRLQLARTITLGVSIAEMLDGPALRYGVPVLAHLVPPDFHHWLPVAVRTLARTLAVLFAWYMQVVIAAVQSALRGGLLCSRALLRWARAHGHLEAESAQEARMAEIVGYILAAAGCYCQWQWGFSAPFPLNIVLLPFTLIEYYVRWAVASPV